jgi:hypothetical protein
MGSWTVVGADGGSCRGASISDADERKKTAEKALAHVIYPCAGLTAAPYHLTQLVVSRPGFEHAACCPELPKGAVENYHIEVQFVVESNGE